MNPYRSGSAGIALIGLLALTAANASPCAAQTSLPVDQTDRTTSGASTGEYDWSEVFYGELENGMKFAVLPRKSDESGVGVNMRVEGGFIAEERPGERGLVHLIEHLAFHGSTNIPPGELAKIGVPVSFPDQSKGTTEWDKSNYIFASRTTDLDDLDTLIFILREIAGELAFEPEEVAKQRISVMREMDDKRYGNRVYADYVAAITPGSPTDVIEAQNSDDVSRASVEKIRSLYHQLYRPDATVLTIVGDVDPEAVAALIGKRFSDWEPVGEPNNPLPPPRVLFDEMKPFSVAAEADSRRGVTLSATMDMPDLQATREEQLQARILDHVAVHAIRARVFAVYPAAKIRVSISDGKHGFRQIMMLSLAKSGEWPVAVSALYGTSCSISSLGWSAKEWGDAKSAAIGDLQGETRNMAAMSNIDLAANLSQTYATGGQLFGPTETLAYAEHWLPQVGRVDAQEWWRQNWERGAKHLRVESPELSEATDPSGLVEEVFANNACVG